MNISASLPILILSLLLSRAQAGQVLFQDDFRGRLGDGWSWIREHREGWRTSPRGLEVLLEPGNMWGPANDAHNLLVRPAPDLTNGPVEFSVRVENHPTNQYEQVDLVWYYDDGHMVKLGRELVDGQLSIVMGRESSDKTRTIKIIPIDSEAVWLKLVVRDNDIRGQFRLPGKEQWSDVGHCDLPASVGRAPKLSLQFYQGPPRLEHWALVTEFRVLRAAE